jgi:hypothetical protein
MAEILKFFYTIIIFLFIFLIVADINDDKASDGKPFLISLFTNFLI